MAETANGRVATDQKTKDGTSPSAAEIQAAIHETRGRLTARLARTAEHVHLLFTSSSAGTDVRDGGVVGGAIRTIALGGRAKRVWSDARRTGLLRRSAIGSVAVAAALTIATYRRKRSSSRLRRLDP
jgi:hypothetical protein